MGFLKEILYITIIIHIIHIMCVCIYVFKAAIFCERLSSPNNKHKDSEIFIWELQVETKASCFLYMPGLCRQRHIQLIVNYPSN